MMPQNVRSLTVQNTTQLPPVLSDFSHANSQPTADNPFTPSLTSQSLLREYYDALFAAHGPQQWWPGRTRFEIIVGAVLTQNTSWTNVERAIRKTTRMVYVETPTNPLMALSDIEAIAQITRRKKVELVVDNTFMSPYFQRPIALGADMVVHSTTKFLNGHSDGLGGVVVCTRQDQAEQLGFVQKAAGAILSPFECWLVLRGTKTLAVRMLQHDCNGRRVAEFLAQHKKMKKVFYPGLLDHPQHELAKRQMTGFGAMITFETGSLANAARMLKRVRVCTLGESLGGVETLISHPATMTHAALGAKGRKEIGITDGMVRISVGIEDVDDIVADLDQALG